MGLPGILEGLEKWNLENQEAKPEGSPGIGSCCREEVPER